MIEKECMPEQSFRCCKCRNILCMLFHKGHNHKLDDLEELMDKGLEEWHNRIMYEIYRFKNNE